MLEIVGTKIILTRGDSASITLTPTEDSEYVPAEGDSIRFAMSKQYGATMPLVLIDIPTDTMVLEIRPEHTKSLPFGTYKYDLELRSANGELVETFVTKAEFVVDKEVY